MKCLLAASELDSTHPTVHEHTIRFKKALDSENEPLAPEVTEVIKKEFTLLPASKPLAEVNDEFLAKHKDSASHVLSAIRVKKVLSNDKSTADKDVISVLDIPTISFQEAIQGLEILKFSHSSELESYRTKASSKWPDVTAFKSST